jgi:hypothetical protein
MPWILLRYERHLRPEYEDANAWTNLASSNPFGEVNGGIVLLSCKVVVMPSDLKVLTHEPWIQNVWMARKGESYVTYCCLDWTGKSPAQEPKGRLKMALISSSCSGQTDTLWPGPSNGDDSDGSVGENEDGTDPLEAEKAWSLGSMTDDDLEVVPVQVGQPGMSDSGGNRGLPKPAFLRAKIARHYAEEDVAGPSVSGIMTGSNEGTSEPACSNVEISRTFVEEDVADPSVSAIRSGSASSSSGRRSISPLSCKLCDDKNHNRHAWGLILHPAEKAEVYYRVGIFISRAKEAGGTDFFKGVEYQTIEIV